MRTAILLLLFVASTLTAAAVDRDPEREGLIEQELARSHPELVADFHAATVALDKQDYKTAAELYGRIHQRVPTFDAALRRLGGCEVELGNPDLGIRECREAVALRDSADNLSTLAYYVANAQTGEPASATREEALDLLNRCRGLPHGDDEDILAAIGQLDIQLRRPLDAAADLQLLLKKYPQSAVGHYLSAIENANEEHWLKADSEIHQAARLGFNPEEVSRVLDAGIREKANEWRLGLLIGGAVAAWAGGLAVLYLLGVLLSRIALRSTKPASIGLPLSSAEARLRRIYRTVINVAGIYYYISLPFVILLVLAAAAAVFYTFLAMGRIPIGLLVGLGIGALATIGAMMKSLFLRRKPVEPGRPLTRAEAPALWELTDQVARKLDTRPIDEIRITPGTDVAVYERGSRREKLRGDAKRILLLGAGGLDGFKQDEFRCVLAHEYGHFAHRDTAGGEIALRVRNDIIGFFLQMRAARQNTPLNLAFHFLRLYHFLFRRISHGATRLQEVLADRIAAQAYGAIAFEGGLRHVIRRQVEFQATVNREAKAAINGRQPLADVYRAAAGSDSAVEADFERAFNRETTDDDSHPSPKDRFRLLAELPRGTEAALSGEVWDLFQDRNAISTEMLKNLQQSVDRARR